MSAAREIAEIVARPARGTAAVLASLLPRRHWFRFDLPMESGALVSGLLTFVVGALTAVHSYLLFARRISAIVAEGLLAAAEGRGPMAPVATGPAAIAPLAFLVTPAGLASGYLVASGLIRFAAAVIDDAQGDPLLTALDRAFVALTARWRRDRAREARERLEGPPAPDVLLTGRDGGAPEADFVVIASRVKDGWDKGVFVVTSEKWYRIGRPFDRRFAGGLRRVYPISEVRDLEVIRRSVYYELPRLSETAR